MDNREPARTRKHGRRVFKTSTGAERIEACRAILAEKSFAKIDGVMVDTFSAGAIIAIHDALKDANREKFLGMQIGKMAGVSFALLNKYGR